MKMKNDDREEIQKKKLGDVRKWYFVWKKRNICSKGSDWKRPKDKKDETERRRETKGVSQRYEQRMKKATKKKHEDLAKKGEIVSF